MRHRPEVSSAATAAWMAAPLREPIASTAFLKYTGASKPAFGFDS